MIAVVAMTNPLGTESKVGGGAIRMIMIIPDLVMIAVMDGGPDMGKVIILVATVDRGLLLNPLG